MSAIKRSSSLPSSWTSCFLIEAIRTAVDGNKEKKRRTIRTNTSAIDSTHRRHSHRTSSSSTAIKQESITLHDLFRSCSPNISQNHRNNVKSAINFDTDFKHCLKSRAKITKNCFRHSLLMLAFMKPPRQKRTKRRQASAVIIDISSTIEQGEQETSAEKEQTQMKEFYRPHVGDENEERGNWSNPAEFVVSCIGFAVSMGNVCFLLIYWILAALVGFPIVLLEHALGQYTSRGPLHCWQYAPAMTGVGLSMIAVSFLTVIYYDVILTWAAYYMFASFTSQLPWEVCDYSSWADYRCEMLRTECLSAERDEIRGADGLCYNLSEISPLSNAGVISDSFLLPIDHSLIRNTSTVIGYWNETLVNKNGVYSMLATAQYYHNHVLGDVESYGLDNFGYPRWSLVLCMALIWLLVFLSLMNGIKSSGKVSYFTCLVPYALLTVLIARGATLPGAYDGIMYFLTPDFELIKQPELWYAAAGQLFYSLSVCWGGMLTLASYNKFRNNIVRDALIVVFADTLTSLLASFAVFSVIGYAAYILERPVAYVAHADAGLAFIIYPKVLAQLPGAVGFSVVFFFMCICLGLDVEFTFSQTVFTALLDCFPIFRKNFRKKALTFAIFCCVCFIFSLPFVCQGGPKLLSLFDNYCATWAVLLIGLLETTSICWIYGYKRFTEDLKLMMPWLPVLSTHIFSVIFWGFLTPAILAFIMVLIWIRYKPRDNTTEEGIGWFLTLFVAIHMPATLAWFLVTSTGSFWQRIKSAFSPSPRWGPYLEKFRKEAKHLEMSILPTCKKMASLHGDDEIIKVDVSNRHVFPNFHYFAKIAELHDWQSQLSKTEYETSTSSHHQEETNNNNNEKVSHVTWALPISEMSIGEDEWVQEI